MSTITDREVEPAPFSLEPSPPPGQVPSRVIDELREACRIATDYSAAFSEACKASAERYDIAPGALKRYVKALEGDKLQELSTEAEDVQALIASGSAEVPT